MAWVATAVTGVTSILSSGSSRKRARKAAAAQRQAVYKAQEWQQKALEQMGYSKDQAAQYINQAVSSGLQYQTAGLQSLMSMMQPYIQTGQAALGQAMNLYGREITADQVANDPNFQQLVQQGEEALLQNAAATGGLRGGNTQAALAQFRPRMIQDEIDRQYNRLFQRAGGLTNIAGMGQAAASTAGQGALQTGSNMANMMMGAGNQLSSLEMQNAANVGNIYGNMGQLELALGDIAAAKNRAINQADTGMYSGMAGLTNWVGANRGWF